MALQLDLSVIPVLVDGMPIPTEDDQPEFLRKLSRLQAFRVRSNGHDFDHDMDNIISAIETAINRPVEAKTIVYRSHADALVAAVKLLKDLPPAGTRRSSSTRRNDRTRHHGVQIYL